MKMITDTIKKIKELDYALMQKTQKRLDSLTKPQGSLGRLEELAKQVVGITRKENPPIKNKVIFTLAGDHGVTEEKVSAYPEEVTTQMVYNFLRGGAGINVLARHIGARVVVIDMGVSERFKSQNLKFKSFKDKKINFGTRNFTKEPAMTREEAIKSIETGIKLVEEELSCGIDILGTGDMGIGNTTASTAISAAIINKSIEELTGRGTGIDEVMLKNKIEAIKKALEINKPDASDPIDVLSKVGGFEIGGLVGIILAGSAKRIPVVIDGFISGAACLLAYKLEPKIKHYVIPSHCSAERGHRIILNHVGLNPLLDLEMRLGEGTGACLGINLVEAAVKILNQMATFKEAAVSERIK
jgi:nicotinate-nucleotide--dimethylbenzimidazole phosphoribosyltransferase